jgi:hypothetical protein
MEKSRSGINFPDPHHCLFGKKNFMSKKLSMFISAIYKRRNLRITGILCLPLIDRKSE